MICVLAIETLCISNLFQTGCEFLWKLFDIPGTCLFRYFGKRRGDKYCIGENVVL